MIYGFFKKKVIPLINFFFPNKTENTYTRLLRVLLPKIDEHFVLHPRPEKVVIDFEKAEVNAFRNCIPNVDVFFHTWMFFPFSQSIWRKIHSLGMQLRYGVDQEYNFALKKFLALAFGFWYVALSQHFLATFKPLNCHKTFLDYFEKFG